LFIAHLVGVPLMAVGVSRRVASPARSTNTPGGGNRAKSI
jgi:hypothetical protein